MNICAFKIKSTMVLGDDMGMTILICQVDTLIRPFFAEDRLQERFPDVG